jgi:hypothetical protein
MIKSRKLRKVGHLAHMGERRGAYREGHCLDDPGIDGRIISEWIFKQWDGEGDAWTGLIWLRIGTGGRLLSV